MYTISNKFARFKQSCRCAICQAAARVNGRAGSSRRAAAYSTATLRQLIVNPYFTATTLYTTILAFAMSIDGGVKKKKLLKLDHAIACERSTIGHLSAEESRIKKKLGGKLVFEEDLQNIIESEGVDDGVNEQQLSRKANRGTLAKGLGTGKAQYSTLARRASSPNQRPEASKKREEDLESHVEEVSDWRKAYKDNPCEHGQALKLDAPVLGPEQQIENIDPQSIYAPPKLRQLLYKHRWTPKKLRTAEIVTARLAVSLLLHQRLRIATRGSGGKSRRTDVEIYNANEPSDEAQIPSKMHQLASLSTEELQKLNKFLYEEKEAVANIDPFDERFDDSLPKFIPKYSQDSAGAYHRFIREVNKNVRAIFQKYRAGEFDLQTTIAKVCNELLNSTAAPNLHTYNILLVEFSSLAKNSSSFTSLLDTGVDTARFPPDSISKPLRKYHAKELGCIIDSIFTALRDARIRPNETTCAAMLYHYIERDDAKAFARLVTLMRGQEEGLMLAHPEINYSPEGYMKTRLRPKVGRSEKIIQAVTPTPTVAEALISGVLHFVGLEQALAMLSSLTGDGWAIDERGLAAIVRHCAHEKNWKSGLEGWDRLRELATNSRTSISSKPRLSCTAYRAYIALCWSCDEREALRIAVNEAVQMCKYSTKSVLASLEPRARSRAHLWLRNSTLDEESRDRRDVVRIVETGDTKQEAADADFYILRHDEGEEEARQERKQKQEQGQERDIVDGELTVSAENLLSTNTIKIPLPILSEAQASAPAPASILTSIKLPYITSASEASPTTVTSPSAGVRQDLQQRHQRQDQPQEYRPAPLPFSSTTTSTTTTTTNNDKDRYTPTTPIHVPIPQSAPNTSSSIPQSTQQQQQHHHPNPTTKLPPPSPTALPILSLPLIPSPSRRFPNLSDNSLHPHADLNTEDMSDVDIDVDVDVSATDIPLVGVSS